MTNIFPEGLLKHDDENKFSRLDNRYMLERSISASTLIDDIKIEKRKKERHIFHLDVNTRTSAMFGNNGKIRLKWMDM